MLPVLAAFTCVAKEMVFGCRATLRPSRMPSAGASDSACESGAERARTITGKLAKLAASDSLQLHRCSRLPLKPGG